MSTEKSCLTWSSHSEYPWVDAGDVWYSVYSEEEQV